MSFGVEFSGSKMQENPFNTAEGQAIVSNAESFWARLARHGRALNNFSQGTNVGSGQTVYPCNVTASPGHRLYPKTATVSADGACVVQISVKSNIPYFGPPNGGSVGTGNLYWIAYIQAGIPFTLNFDGDLWVEDGGTFSIAATAGASAVNVYGGLHGIEVVADVQP